MTSDHQEEYFREGNENLLEMPFLDAFGKEVLHGVSMTHSMGVVLDCRLALKHHVPAAVSSALRVLWSWTS